VQEDLGLYFHIPFCERLCHYCDFAKTARYAAADVTRYLGQLQSHFNSIQARHQQYRYGSVFFGGGTPGLLSKEYEALFRAFRPYLLPQSEISLEANPNNISIEKLVAWRDLGFNRLSIGVQSFSDIGLKFLTRDHSEGVAKEAIALASKYFENFNIDLIYGWHKQTEKLWRADLEQAVSLGVPHLSLYNLTYEANTPIGRRNIRGLVPSTADEKLFNFYTIACELLAEAGYVHDEVSNWSKPGKSCLHNAGYWRGAHYVGVGAGAHGYLPAEGSAIGKRYYYGKQTPKFLNMNEDFYKVNRDEGIVFEERSEEDWLMEYIGSSFRTKRGCDLEKIKQVIGKNMKPRPVVQRGLDEKLLMLENGHIKASSPEWFRENSWAVELIMSF
jgi:oxygen-independent coproporphyrinogen-3 oxidase